MLKYSIKKIYLYTVCIPSLALSMIFLGLGIWNLIEYRAPEFTLSRHLYQCHLSNESYRDCNRHKSNDEFPKGEELSRIRKASLEDELKAESREGLKSFFQMLLALFLSGSVFFVHWKLARKEK